MEKERKSGTLTGRKGAFALSKMDVTEELNTGLDGVAYFLTGSLANGVLILFVPGTPLAVWEPRDHFFRTVLLDTQTKSHRI